MTHFDRTYGRDGPLAVLGVVGLLTLAACGGSSSGGNGGNGNTNRAPVLTSAASATLSENASGTVYTATASDPDGDRLTFGIASGDDAALFAIDPVTGTVRFIMAPDFEWPRDGNRDNVYQFTVTVSDGRLSVRRAVSLSVTNLAGRVSSRRVASGFSEPLFLLGRGDGTDRVIVVQKGGLARVLHPVTGEIEATPFLDVRTLISTENERGLLGLALAPDFANSGAVYAFLTAQNGDLQVRRFTATANGVSPGSGEIIISIPHPLANHNGGWIDFDADGNLIIATGDGGGAGDPSRNGQNRNSLLGKMLRIDPRRDDFPGDASRNYGIPAANPFVTAGSAPEIWHMGLRNPHRNSFDRETGNLYIADVGQEGWEEVNLVRPTDPGLNFGWNIREGTDSYAGGPATGLTPPVLQIEHGTGPLQGRSITGGYVYRGPVMALRGHYVFGDFMNRRIWSLPQSQFVQGVTLTATALTDRTSDFAPATGAIGNMTSFGVDDAGNLYVVDYDGEIFLISERDEAP